MSLHRGCNHIEGSLFQLFCPMRFLKVDRPRIEDLHRDQVLNLLDYLNFVLFVVVEAFSSSLRHSRVVGPSKYTKYENNLQPRFRYEDSASVTTLLIICFM